MFAKSIFLVYLLVDTQKGPPTGIGGPESCESASTKKNSSHMQKAQQHKCTKSLLESQGDE